MQLEITSFEGIDYLHVEMENEQEKCLALMSILQDLGCTIHKYYWRSKQDETCLELIEPKIYDAFDFILDVIGSKQKFSLAITQFKERVKLLDNLPKLDTPITEQEIKELAGKVTINPCV